MNKLAPLLGLLVASTVLHAQMSEETLYHEKYRPQIHFSPPANWMNDPNGMVYYNGVYHLFYQYYPDSTVWGPMHWAHATSGDLVHWRNHAVALYPDSLGYIFSGSAVVDIENTSGFGVDGKTPLVAIFTHHNIERERQGGTNDYEYQSLAYSLDDGKTWTKYKGNPVLKNPGIKDFRDPKVIWYEKDRKWIMTLATLDHITFYSSPDLKEWTQESVFGKQIGAHGGVWECPDLFPLEHNGKKIWVLIVNLNPGGPNGGSGSQYFVGDFDGKQFIPFNEKTKWLDYGPDEYAGVTWSNTGDRKIFLGWMSNWQYAEKVPTGKWRGATTIPRDLRLEKAGDEYFVASSPVPELKVLEKKPKVFTDVDITKYDLTANTGKATGPFKLTLTSKQVESFNVSLSNKLDEKLFIGFDKLSNEFYIDRRYSGETGFEENFGTRQTAPRLTVKTDIAVTLYIDNASIELFADDGITVMTAIFFPNEPFSNIQIDSPGGMKMNNVEYTPLKSIWK